MEKVTKKTKALILVVTAFALNVVLFQNCGFGIKTKTLEGGSTSSGSGAPPPGFTPPPTGPGPSPGSSPGPTPTVPPFPFAVRSADEAKTGVHLNLSADNQNLEITAVFRHQGEEALDPADVVVVITIARGGEINQLEHPFPIETQVNPIKDGDVFWVVTSTDLPPGSGSVLVTAQSLSRSTGSPIGEPITGTLEIK